MSTHLAKPKSTNGSWLTRPRFNQIDLSFAFCITWFSIFIIVIAIADYFFALAGVEFIRGFIYVRPIAEGRGNALSAAGGMFAAFGALFTFFLNYAQKNAHQRDREELDRNLAAENREQERRHHEFNSIDNEYTEVSREFTQDRSTARISSTIKFAQLALTPNPRIPQDQYSSTEFRSLYPWFDSSVRHLATAFRLFTDKDELIEVHRSFTNIVNLLVELVHHESDNRAITQRQFDYSHRFILEILGETSSIVRSHFEDNFQLLASAWMHSQSDLEEFDSEHFLDFLWRQRLSVQDQTNWDDFLKNYSVSHFEKGGRYFKSSFFLMSSNNLYTSDYTQKLAHQMIQLEMISNALLMAFEKLRNKELVKVFYPGGGRPVNLKKCLLVGKWIHNLDLSNCDLNFCQIQSTIFDSCDFSRIKLRSSTLNGVRFLRCNLQSSDLVECRGVDLGFLNCMIDHARIGGLRILTDKMHIRAQFQGTDWDHADFQTLSDNMEMVDDIELRCWLKENASPFGFGNSEAEG